MLELLQSWLLTYLLHGTLLLLGALLLTRLLPRSPVAFQEALWRTALFGGLLTASLQVAMGTGVPTGPALPSPSVAETESERLGPVALLPEAALFDVEEDIPAGPAMVTAAADRAVGPTTSAPAVGRTWATVLAAAWSLGMLLLIVRLLRTKRRLGSRIAARVVVSSGPLRERLDELCRRAGVQRHVGLTTLDGLSSPIALGVRRPEIVVPTRVLQDLDAAQQEAMLAHELAHHVRKDPLNLALCRTVEAVFFFQPLNRLAGRRLREAAEMLADGWAVQQTGQGRALAECLTVVARWIVAHDEALPATAMAAHGSMLHRRVERLLDAPDTRPTRRVSVRLAAALPVALVALLAPAVATRPATAAASRTPTTFELRPSDDDGHALEQLDAEIRDLEGELSTLLALLDQVQRPPDELRKGVVRLQARLRSLSVQRHALSRTAPVQTEDDR